MGLLFLFTGNQAGNDLNNITEPDYQHWITPLQAVEMASLGGAKGLNVENLLGSITVGKQADLVLYDLNNLSLLPCTDPIGLLVLGRPVNVVHSAWVNGKQIINNGKITTINVDELQQELLNRSHWETPSQSTNVVKLAPHYRQVMGLD
jgi:cytosine/adenosine deaminase-related metal-dependent hydrolase